MKSGRRSIERLELQFDGRAWSIGYYAASNETQGAATEYVLPGETVVHAWTELVTIERLPPAQRHAGAMGETHWASELESVNPRNI